MATKRTLFSVFLDVQSTLSSENMTGPIHEVFSELKNVVLTDGIGSGQADRAASDTRTLAGGANEDVDLAGGLTDPFGAAVTFAKLKLLIIYNPSATQTLSLKQAAANGITGMFNAAADILKIKPLGVFVWYDPTGITITGATGDLINIANSAGSSVDYKLFAVGTSS